MEPIKKIVEETIKHSASTDAKTSGCVRMSIWTGPCMNKVSGTIYQSKGYYKETHTVLAVPKTKLNAFFENRFYLNPDDIKQTGRRLATGNIVNEYLNRIFKRAKEEKPVNVNKAEQTKLIRLLTFFNTEVYECSVIPGGTNFLPDGIPDPLIHDVEANLLIDGKIDYKNVRFVHSPYVRRETINTVPIGGGIKLRETQAHSVRFNPGNNYYDQSRSAGLYTQSQYANPFCFLYDRDISRDGDLWFAGLKSSIGNGIIELWADDIGGGPMLRASRQSVYEAAARYYKDINPTNLRYNGYRVNPMAAILPSNSVTPVKTYIEDIFGDPTFYAGIFAALNQLLGTLDTDSKNLYKYIDEGSFDYNALYNNKLGQEI